MREIARSTIAFHAACHIAALLAEAAWLRGDLAQCRAEAEPTLGIASQRNLPRFVGELAYWLWRAGGIAELPPNAAEPYASQIRGHWQAAAAMWEQFGCPYEQALALMDGDEAAQRQALAILERLGAGRAAALVRRKLRLAGVRRIPRGPRSATRANAFGLTARQTEILALLAEGLTNAEIAARLHLSPRTVDHHVAAILAKLDAPSRETAVQAAARQL
jgi:DNA-binding CsgD family transcriptional regulator